MKSRSANAWIVTTGLLSAAVSVGASCGDSKDEPDAEQSAVDAGESSNCVGVPTFRVGLTAMSDDKQVMAEIVDAEPIHKFENDWVVKLSDPDGKPLEGLDLYKVQPFMPVHGHDGGFDPTITTTKDAGTYDVKRINMWMKDQWEVRFFVHVGEEDHEVIFDVCIPP